MNTKKVSNSGQTIGTSKPSLIMLLLLICFMSPVISNAQNLLHSPQRAIIDADRDRLLISNYGSGGSLVQIDSDGNQDYFVKRAGMSVAVIVVSVLFALMHFHLPSFVPLFMLSAILCLTYWRTSSLWTSIGVHMIFNAVSILALNIAG